MIYRPLWHDLLLAQKTNKKNKQHIFLAIGFKTNFFVPLVNCKVVLNFWLEICKQLDYTYI